MSVQISYILATPQQTFLYSLLMGIRRGLAPANYSGQQTFSQTQCLLAHLVLLFYKDKVLFFVTFCDISRVIKSTAATHLVRSGSGWAPSFLLGSVWCLRPSCRFCVFEGEASVGFLFLTGGLATIAPLQPFAVETSIQRDFTSFLMSCQKTQFTIVLVILYLLLLSKINTFSSIQVLFNCLLMHTYNSRSTKALTGKLYNGISY